MLHEAGTQMGHLGAKTRELIALAVAVTNRCDSCIAKHAKKATDLRVTEAEMAESLGVAVAMNAGAALAYLVVQWTRAETCRETSDRFRRRGCLAAV